ncbi:hypothetical protein ABEB36_004789 [Hypothenemus hampei]|uniref:Conserved oligomeric Golgi complex subunit 3 n=1 Tax=Hypothenemus hampei TaxID=57062 RepID=A0ABD1EVU3_HYPHA
MSSRPPKSVVDDQMDKKVQENVAKWQSTGGTGGLAPLDDEQTDLVFELCDLVNSLYSKQTDNETVTPSFEKKIWKQDINNNKDLIKWLIKVEQEIQYENLKAYQEYYENLGTHLYQCGRVLERAESTVASINDLQNTYLNVVDKTNYLHYLSEQLMVQQKVLRLKKTDINEKLRCFVNFSKYRDSIERFAGKHQVNTIEYIEILDHIDEALTYLSEHLHFKESKIYKMKYESLLNKALTYVYNYVNDIISETTKQLINSDSLNQKKLMQQLISSSESVFSLYYGKFQSASAKVKLIVETVEGKQQLNHHHHYKNTLYDCQKSYFSQRLPILEVALAKALNELQLKHKSDYSVLFRSCCLFIVKVCSDETSCFHYFFKNHSKQLHDYLGTLCQHLYDTLRPCLIVINHIEVLSDLCGILKNEIINNDQIIGDDHLSKYVDVIQQLLEDVEERLVFRTNVFFKHDLNDYKPSSGDLAYPEKLQQMENILVELKEKRSDSRASVLSLESQEVAQINAAAPTTHLRSYTGNSPADLHGMWYPTVKRTLVCLSRLYFCLDRDTFQALAQEALIVCLRTVDNAAQLISTRRTPVDGNLFQIKHLLIIREQIAPFQVDFTTKELSLDFSGVQRAAVDLLHKPKQIFAFSGNNALLEFLLEGTPKVREYLVDSRKEIDKQLKFVCESFINYVTRFLLENLVGWVEKAEKILKIIRVENGTSTDLTVKAQSYGQPEYVAGLIKDAQKNIKTRIPEIQRSMQLYLANRETEFILFRPIKNNLINVFLQIDQILTRGGYSQDDRIEIACPSPEQVNILICSVSLSFENEST